MRNAAGGGAIDPFCEQHNSFMKNKEIRKLPVSSESEAMNLLSNREFAKITDLPSTDDTDNYATIHVWYCAECMNGYILMATQLTIRVQKKDGSSDSESKTRLVFSSKMNQSEADIIAGN